MLTTPLNNKFLTQLRLVFCIILLEYCFFIFSGVSYTFLQGDAFFSLGADPAAFIIFGLKIPQFIIAHQWMGIFLDTVTLLLLFLFIKNPLSNRIAVLLLLLLFIFYITITGYLTHRNFQSGFFLIFFPFIFKKDFNKYLAFEAMRYFILLFYVTAAFFKISNGALINPAHFSHILSTQFIPYFFEANTGTRTNINLFLISHPGISYILYICSFLIEGFVITGFFTKRFDSLIAVLLLVFHVANWILMDIAPFGQLGFICLLFISKGAGNYFLKKPVPKS